MNTTEKMMFMAGFVIFVALWGWISIATGIKSLREGKICTGQAGDISRNESPFFSGSKCYMCQVWALG